MLSSLIIRFTEKHPVRVMIVLIFLSANFKSLNKRKKNWVMQAAYGKSIHKCGLYQPHITCESSKLDYVLQNL